MACYKMDFMSVLRREGDDSHTCLVSNDKNILLTLELHDDRLKSYYDVAIRFPSPITIVKFIVIPVGKVIGVSLL
jgi:hypothetical protein